jgi:hypothetical protein
MCRKNVLISIGQTQFSTLSKKATLQPPFFNFADVSARVSENFQTAPVRRGIR